MEVFCPGKESIFAAKQQRSVRAWHTLIASHALQYEAINVLWLELASDEGQVERNVLKELVFLCLRLSSTFTFLTVYAVLVCVKFCILLKDICILVAAIFFSCGDEHTRQNNTLPQSV